jgi:hypothetical protein
MQPLSNGFTPSTSEQRGPVSRSRKGALQCGRGPAPRLPAQCPVAAKVAARGGAECAAAAGTSRSLWNSRRDRWVIASARAIAALAREYNRSHCSSLYISQRGVSRCRGRGHATGASALGSNPRVPWGTPSRYNAASPAAAFPLRLRGQGQVARAAR